MTVIGLWGAGGKMGCRIVDALARQGGWDVRCVEPASAGVERLAARGVRAHAPDDAAAAADVAILAVPDALIGRVARAVVPRLRPGALVLCLDPAAPLAGELPERADVALAVAHPCHPPVVNDETEPAARADFFGGIAAKQHAVAALMRGDAAQWPRVEAVARAIFAPVMRLHRITVEQMAILEPALSETVAATLMVVIREALDEAIARGVPAEAARDFLLGHLNVDIGILYGFVDARLSDGALMAVERGKRALIRDDWRRVFEPEAVMREVRAIIAGVHAARASA